MGNRRKRYTHVIFDADDTLLNYRADERDAFFRLFSALGVSPSPALLSYCNDVSEKIWTETGLYDVSSPRIQREYHALYRSHVERIFEEIFSFCSKQNVTFSKAISPAEARDLFLKELETGGNYVDGAEETLCTLHSRGYIVSVATNGLAAIQLGRTKPFRSVVSHLFVSESLGAIKPAARFFELLLKELNAKKEDCFFVGDSLSSDVTGAKNAGIDCCYFNPLKRQIPPNVPQPNAIVERLPELFLIL